MTIKNAQRIGLAVMDTQTLHVGHVRLLLYMLSTTPKCVVGIGSVKKHGTEGHPFTFDQRVTMIETIFGQQVFKFIPLNDIDSSIDNDAWCNYVLKKVASIGLQEPTDYFSGSRIDAKWYEFHFANLTIDEGTMLQDTAVANVFESVNTGRRIHIMDRDKSGFPSGREIRFLIEKRDPEWKRYVPERLHDFIEWNYPPHLRQALRGLQLPDPETCPVGTRFIQGHQFDVGATIGTFELKDDNQWRPLVAVRDEKAEHARNRRGK